VLVCRGLDEIGDPHALGIRANVDDELMWDGTASDMV
jgi:2-keto-4-pentenoate hydratase/2-oxohepta-3-ene-1,7-dioic acid hydratase in catechol pathway